MIRRLGRRLVASDAQAIVVDQTLLYLRDRRAGGAADSIRQPSNRAADRRRSD